MEDAILFLEGKQTELLDVLRARMTEAAAAERFEEAGRLRDQLEAIERTLMPQKIVGAEARDRDVFGYAREGDRFLIYALYVRAGHVTNGEAFPFRRQAFPDRELLGSFLSLYYQDPGHPVPEEVIVPIEIHGMQALAALLTECRGRAVRLIVPTDPERLGLLHLSEQNAKRWLRERAPTPGADVLERLRARLGLKRVPHRMECFDVSHFLGQTIVAAGVAMTEGKPDRDRYRRYRTRTARVGDDCAALYEVVTRRLRRGLAENDLPDLLVVDGGKEQLASAQAAMKDLGVTDLDVIALAKRRERAEGAEVRLELPERIYVPARRDAIVLPQDSAELLLLTRLRDEAHRFAIAYQRRLMRRERLRSVLEDIRGIGATRRRALLSHFGSLRAIANADIEALAAVSGIGEAHARRIHAHFHPPNDSRHAGTPAHPR